MNENKEQFKRDVHKDPAQLEREADAVRADMEDTLHELQQQFQPGEMINQVLRVVRENGGDFGSNLAAQVRNNPLPTLLAGLGLTWLMASSKRPSSPPRQHGLSGERLHGAADSARSAAHRVGDTTSSAAHHAADTARGAAGQVSEASRRVADRASAGAHRLGERYEHLHREQPLVLGALAVATGALLGALLPSTEAEDEWAGEASDQTKDRLKEEGGRRLEQAESAASEAAEAAGQAVKSQAGESGTSGSSGGSNSVGSPGAAGNPAAGEAPGVGGQYGTGRPLGS